MTAPARTRTGIESARRVSDCVTALLRDQPFFGSLALRLPIRADAGRETLASDGQEICYAPQWVADTDADLIKTAIGRVVLACALKHHTRRNERDPEHWQRASQMVTHGLLSDSGFKLPPDAEAWDGISVEQGIVTLTAWLRHGRCFSVSGCARYPTVVTAFHRSSSSMPSGSIAVSR